MKYFLSSAVLAVVLSVINPVDVQKSVTEDNITLQDQRVWYTMYKGAYIYVKDYDAVGCKDFADLFEKMQLVRNTAMPAKGNANFVGATDLSKYLSTDKDGVITNMLEWTPENRTDFAEDLFAIAEGLRLSIGAEAP